MVVFRVLALSALLGLTGCSTTSETKQSDAPVKTPTDPRPSFDPLSVEEPERPDLDRQARFTEQDGRRLIRYHFDAWRYAARTGYEVAWNEVSATDSVGCLDLEGELREFVIDRGNVIDVGRPKVEFLNVEPPLQLDANLWSALYAVRIDLPKRSVRDAAGAVVTTLPACQQELVARVISQNPIGPIVRELTEVS